MLRETACVAVPSLRVKVALLLQCNGLSKREERVGHGSTRYDSVCALQRYTCAMLRRFQRNEEYVGGYHHHQSKL